MMEVVDVAAALPRNRRVHYHLQSQVKYILYKKSFQTYLIRHFDEHFEISNVIFCPGLDLSLQLKWIQPHTKGFDNVKIHLKPDIRKLNFPPVDQQRCNPVLKSDDESLAL